MTEPRFMIDVLCGQCPVQGSGTIDRVPWYFRARGSHWTFSVGRDVFDPEWQVRVRYGEDAHSFAAGWMEETEAREIIEKCGAEYLASKAKKHNGIGDKPYVEAAHED